MQASPIAGIAFACAAAVGCGGEGQGGVVPASAFERPKQDDAIAKLDAARKAADAKADAQAQARAQTEEAELARLVDAVAIVPEAKPRSLGAACADVAAAMDALVQRQFAGEATALADWNAGKSATLAELRDTCEDEDTIATAACKAHAMKHADDRLVGDAFGLMARCTDKFGKKADAKAR
jgi:hypothetical protein